MPRRPQAERTSDGGHETDQVDEEEEDDDNDDDAEVAPAVQPGSSLPPPPPLPAQNAGDMMMNLLKQVPQEANLARFKWQQRVNMLLSHTHTNGQVLVREPALIGLSDSGQLTGKVIRLKLMVFVLASCPP